MKKIIVEKMVPVSICYYECENCGYTSEQIETTFCDVCQKEVCKKCSEYVSDREVSSNKHYRVCRECLQQYPTTVSLMEAIEKSHKEQLKDCLQKLDTYQETKVEGIEGKEEASKALLAKLLRS